MNPLSMMQNDMATLTMSSQKVFELWNDKVSADLKTNCIEKLQDQWNRCLEQLNHEMNCYMRSEKEIDDTLRDLRKLCNY